MKAHNKSTWIEKKFAAQWLILIQPTAVIEADKDHNGSLCGTTSACIHV